MATRATEASTAPIVAARLRARVVFSFAEAAVRVRVIVVDRMSCPLVCSVFDIGWCAGDLVLVEPEPVLR